VTAAPNSPLGLYIAVPFCRTKCTYCNFASEVFAPARYREYCELLAREIVLAARADGLAGAELTSVYWGGGTPTLLPADGFAQVMAAIRDTFTLAPGLEHTVEAAPGTVPAERLELLAAHGVNRISFGVQSFADPELRAVGRLHRASTVHDDLSRARRAGIANLNLDLIAGLPHQTQASWRATLEATLEAAPPHVSVYMLEVDADSRLGAELLASGNRYHAAAVPTDDFIADAYEEACARLEAAGIRQYEISNFARAGTESCHNLGYWLRQPYLGVGLDAHSFLTSPAPRRFANPDTLAAYLAPLRAAPESASGHLQLPRSAPLWLSAQAEREERYFLGLRRRAGVPLPSPVEEPVQAAAAARHLAGGLLETVPESGAMALSACGRLLANRVLADFLEPRQRGAAPTASGQPLPGIEARPQRREGGLSKRWPSHPAGVP
jgi:oxygen-independent coproporphyrinogen-3 oxidase